MLSKQAISLGWISLAFKNIATHHEILCNIFYTLYVVSVCCCMEKLSEKPQLSA